jgi:hypothetical protein
VLEAPGLGPRATLNKHKPGNSNRVQKEGAMLKTVKILMATGLLAVALGGLTGLR